MMIKNNAKDFIIVFSASPLYSSKLKGIIPDAKSCHSTYIYLICVCVCVWGGGGVVVDSLASRFLAQWVKFLHGDRPAFSSIASFVPESDSRLWLQSYSRLTTPLRLCRFAAPLAASLSPKILRDRTFKLPWKQMLATRTGGPGGGLKYVSLGSHGLWHSRVTPQKVIQTRGCTVHLLSWQKDRYHPSKRDMGDPAVGYGWVRPGQKMEDDRIKPRREKIARKVTAPPSPQKS